MCALDGIALRVGPGSTVALLGPNGAGKSTMIELLLGLLEADHGSARLFGSSPGQAIAAGRVGAMLQDTKLMSGVRVGALLRVVRRAYPTPGDLPGLIRVAGIDGLLSRQTDQLSVGESQRVRIPYPHIRSRLNLNPERSHAPGNRSRTSRIRAGVRR